MENFLTIAPPTSKDGAALCAATLQQRGIILSPAEQAALAAAQKLCGVLALPPEYKGGAAAFAKSLAPRIMVSLPSKLCGVFV